VYAGRRIKVQVTGRGTVKPFRYRSLGTAAYISRGRALLSLGPLHLSGFPGWLGWLFIHITFLTTGFRNRVGALLTWGAAIARDDRRERSFITHQAGRLRDIYPSLADDAAGSGAGGSPAAGRGVSQAPGQGGPGPSGAR
jgi:NADH dehydrogenase